MLRKIFIFCLLVSFISCNRSVMFKADKDYKFDTFPATLQLDYKIVSNDLIDFRIFTNDGFKLIDIINPNSQTTASSITVIVEPDGFVKLPVLGRVLIKGLTKREAEQMLEEKYSTYYNKPFVVLNVLNKRITIFPGSAGTGIVLTLKNENISVIEALGMVGGIPSSGKSNKIKLIRGDLKNPQIQLIDLSTIEGMKQANLSVQPNDIIYVEPKPKLSQEILAEITPYLGLLTSFLLVYDIFTRTY